MSYVSAKTRKIISFNTCFKCAIIGLIHRDSSQPMHVVIKTTLLDLSLLIVNLFSFRFVYKIESDIDICYDRDIIRKRGTICLNLRKAKAGEKREKRRETIHSIRGTLTKISN